MSDAFDDCPECRTDAAGIARLLELAALDPLRTAEPALARPEMQARVQAEIDRRASADRRRRALWPVALAAGAALVLLLARVPAPAPPPAVREAAVSADALLRMESTVGREQAVRYLQGAGDVLLSVTAGLPHCDPRERRAVGVEAARSRALLADRRLLLDIESDPLAVARPVIEDVDLALAEVAALDPCAKPSDLQAIADRIARDRLLMKIGVLARELAG